MNGYIVSVWRHTHEPKGDSVMLKINILKDIRKELEIEQSNRPYFSSVEVNAICNLLNKNADLSGHVSTRLSKNISFWKTQATIDTHASAQNLKAILSNIRSLKESKSSLDLCQIIRRMPPSMLENAETISFVDNKLTIKFKNH
jgi:hypothetical protein